MALQIRRGPTADRMSYTPVVGELIWDTSTNSLYIGNGITPGGLPAGTLVTEDVQDITAAMLINGTHQNITFTYNDTTGRINSTFDLSTFNGTLTADGFIGSHYANDSTLLLNALTGAVNLNGTVKGHIIPSTNIAYDLGSASYRFRDLYLSGSSIKLGSATITATGSTVNLPAGSTINGIVLGAGVEAGMNYNINLVGDDSTVIINARTKAVNAASLTIGSAVNLPAGSTINGVAIGSGSGVETGMNYNINIVGDDSTVIVNARTKSISVASLSVVNPVRLPGGSTIAGSAIALASGSVVNLATGSTLNGTAFGFRVSGEDSSIVSIANGDLLQFRGDQGIQVASQAGKIINISADITAVRPSLRNDSTPAYIPFLGATGAPSYIGTDTALRYFASTNTLECTTFSAASVTTTDLLAGNITATNQLTLLSNLNDGSINSRLVTVGNNITDGRFQIINNTYSSTLALANIVQVHATADSRNFQFNRARGTSTAPTIVSSGDDIIDLSFAGHDGASYQVRAAISATVDGAVSAGVVPTKLDFLTGTSAASVAMSIGSSGRTTFSGAISLVSYATTIARDAAITSPTAGMMIFLTATSKFQGYTGAVWADLN
jgi:hypothetical protein